MKKAKPIKKAAEAEAASTTTASGLDLGAIRELALIAEEFGLMEIEADPSGHVRISRRGPDVQLGVGAGASMGIGSPKSIDHFVGRGTKPRGPRSGNVGVIGR